MCLCMCVCAQVFLSSLVSTEVADQATPPCPGDRHFLLIVGLEQTLLCMLMQQVTAPSNGHAPNSYTPSLDAVYVDRGRALLLDLRAQDLLNQDFRDSSLLPALISADIALRSVFRRSSKPLLSVVSQHSVHSPPSARVRKHSDPFGIRSSSSKGSESDEDEEEGPHLVGSRRSHSMLHLKPNFRQRKVRSQRGDFPSSGDLRTSKKGITTPRPPYS